MKSSTPTGMGVECPVEDLIEQNALFVANHSGGKDSQAMLIKLLERVPARQILVVHASLGDVEWPGAMELAQRQAQDAGLPFIVAKASKTFFEMVEHRHRVRPGPNSPCWPSARNRQCTSDLKRGPIQREVRRYAKEHGFSIVVTCMGIRAQESSGRAKREAFRHCPALTTRNRTWFEWLPIHQLGIDEVIKTITDANQSMHWAYAEGNNRLSCIFCIMGSRSDLLNGKRLNPELYERYVELERRTGYTMHQSRKSLDELTNIEREPDMCQGSRTGHHAAGHQ